MSASWAALAAAPNCAITVAIPRPSTALGAGDRCPYGMADAETSCQAPIGNGWSIPFDRGRVDPRRPA